jgi:glycosyltransferase involved in cell wall biosynthesis
VIMNPLVSVIIPSWNRADMTMRAVHSVLNQSYRHFELLVVNDGSNEDYSEVKNLVESSGHTYIYAPHAGVSAARNRGISSSQGKWISFLDSDDLWHPEKLKTQMEYVQAHPDCLVLQSYEEWIRNGARVTIPERLRPASGDAFKRSLELCCISPSSVVLAREVLEKTGVFDERCIVCEDYDLWLRVTTYFSVHLITQPLVVKYSAPHAQLSRSQIAMDRFRVYALLKYLLSEEYPAEKKALARDILLKKLNILYTGAIKRENNAEARQYQKITGYLAACTMPEHDSPVPAEQFLKTIEPLLIDRRVEEHEHS